jgi:ABC-2 type transport system permease protein
MSTSTNVAHDPRLAEPVRLSGAPSPLEPYLWSLRREFWEYRSLYIAPIVVAIVFLFGYLISLARLSHKIRSVAVDPTIIRDHIVAPYNFAGLAMMGATLLVSIYYCFDALHGERRDRSILFWKSLPVSDLTAVLAKATIPIIILPLLTIVLTIAMHLVMLVMGGSILSASAARGQFSWSDLPLIQIWTMLLYHMVAIHGLWFAPFYAWMLLVSAWARRAPFLWGTLPPLLIALLEKVAFNTTHFVGLIGSIMAGGPTDASFPPNLAGHSLSHIHPGQYLFSVNLWMALTVAAALLMAAARVRRYRGPN